MRIVCPACAATYELPDARLAPGQAVRCARCGTDWTPLETVPEEAVAEPEPEPPPPEPNPEPPSPLVAPPEERYLAPPPARRSPALMVAWGLSILVLVVAAWGFFAGRAQIMHAWPASERIYMAFGVHAEP